MESSEQGAPWDIGARRVEDMEIQNLPGPYTEIGDVTSESTPQGSDVPMDRSGDDIGGGTTSTSTFASDVASSRFRMNRQGMAFNGFAMIVFELA